MGPHRNRECELRHVRRNLPQRDRELTAETCWVNVTVTPEEESTEDWLRHDVQNTIEHSLRVW